MISATGYVPISAIRPTDLDMVFPIFRNGTWQQLLAAAELKATQGGYQTAFSDAGFGGGALAHLPDLPRFLGGDADDEETVLPESLRRLRTHGPSAATGGSAPARPPQAPTPGSHHALEGLTPAKATPADGRTRAGPAGGGRSLDGDMGEEKRAAELAGREEAALAEDRARLARREARAAAAEGEPHGHQSAAARAVAIAQEAAIRDNAAKQQACFRGMYPNTFRAIHGDNAPSAADSARLPLRWSSRPRGRQ
jgi:hypothetical protein